MVCGRCGRNNPQNVKNCIGCGAPLYDARQRAMYGANVNNKKKNKQTETIIVVIIIVLVAALAVMAGVFIYRANKPKTNAFHGGGGGGGMSQAVSRPQETRPPAPTSAPQSYPTAAPPTVAPPTAAPPTAAPQQDNRYARKQEFLNRAGRIEERYDIFESNSSLSQSEINRESYEIFEEWDLLLNDVYQYLQTILSDSRFNSLRESEIEWIEEKESAIEEAAADWIGGSGEPMVRNGVAIDYTSDRCYYLISLIE